MAQDKRFPRTSTDIINRLLREGWYRVKASSGHQQFKHPARPGRVTVPHPRKDFPIGTLRSIYRQAGRQ